ncbi:LysM domain-containing protein [Colwellia asteriadis]|uniref:LysM domain-containing protein n=1 Tax=Colwellia asteriadis TaxID=517723 RepID=A0ABP3WH24_9GAMM
MLKKLLLSLILFTPPLVSLADQLKINDNAPKSYIVEKGDTLWDISSVFLQQPWLWPKLWRLNPEINNPHLIYPGDVLNLVLDEQGEPMLVVASTTKEAGTAQKQAFKWTPTIRTELKNDDSIKMLPLQVVAPYIVYDSLLSEEQIETAPHVIGSDEGYRMSTDGFKVYVNKDLDLAKTYAIYSQGEELIDPETEEPVGYYMHIVGTAQAITTGNMSQKTPATLKVNAVKREIHAGDVVLPVNEGQLLPANFSMQAGDVSLKGSIIKAVSDNREFGQFEVVMVNLGSEKQAKMGDVLSIKRASPQVLKTSNGPVYEIEASSFNKVLNSDPDYIMPEEDLGKMMIFRVYEKASLALILQTTKPARLQDIITSPQS